MGSGRAETGERQQVGVCFRVGGGVRVRLGGAAWGGSRVWSAAGGVGVVVGRRPL